MIQIAVHMTERLQTDSCITQLKAQGPSRTCNESKEEEEEEGNRTAPHTSILPRSRDSVQLKTSSGPRSLHSNRTDGWWHELHPSSTMPLTRIKSLLERGDLFGTSSVLALHPPSISGPNTFFGFTSFQSVQSSCIREALRLKSCKWWVLGRPPSIPNPQPRPRIPLDQTTVDFTVGTNPNFKGV